jgi:subfamily B ATP-binding cassette protein MsbA
MRKFLQIVNHYIQPYRYNALLNIVFNLFAAVFSLFSLGLLIPFLGILFDSQQLVTNKPELAFSTSAILDYFYYFISQIIMAKGKISALLYVSGIVMVTIFFKNLAVYFANFFMAPLRNGIVKDIRNAIYHKILVLDLRFFSEERKGDIISRITSDAQEFEW